MITDAPFGWATGGVVLDSIPGKHLDAPVVHFDGEVDGKFAVGHAQQFAIAGVEIENVSGNVELALCVMIRIFLMNGHPSTPP